MACSSTQRLSLSPFILIVIIVAMSTLSWSPLLASGGGQHGRALLISSYHPGFPAFFHQINGIKSVFDPEHILLDVEFMDTKRFKQKENRDNFKESLRFKLAHLKPYDIVMTADDNALNFALDQQNDLLKGLPIIFFGVNNVDKALEQNDNEMVTGVVEDVSMADTISLMLKLHPQTKKMVALVDASPSGQADLKRFYDLEGNFKDVKFEDICLADMSFDQFKQRLREIGDDTAVLLLSAYHDNQGKSLQFHDSLDLIARNLNRPLYHLWHHGLGEGVLGGKLVSHFDQGQSAALMALKVLKGTPLRDISVSSQSPNRYYFDHRQLQRFRLDEAGLPPDSVVLFKPESFLHKNIMMVLWLLFLFISLVTIVIVLVFNALQRRRSEEKLRESEGRFRSTFEQAAVGILHLDLKGEFLRVNRRFCDMLGYSRDEFRLLSLRDISHPEDMKTSEQMRVDLLSGKADKMSTEKRYIRKDGSMMWGHLTLSLRLDEQGLPVHFIGVIEDIGERKAAEEEKEKLEDKLLQSQKMEALGTLAGGVAHDFNNLLAAILGYSELALDSVKEGEDCAEDLEQLIKSAERGRELVRQILTFSRKMQVELQPLDLNKEVKRVSEILKHALPKMIEIKIKLDPDLQAIAADQTQIEQVLLNLGSNAADAMPQGGTLRIETSNVVLDEQYCRRHAEVSPGPYVLLEVADTGSGMDENTLVQIFDPFFTTKDVGKGTGLGLSTVFGIIKEHGGAISCMSEIGQGTVFKMFLPVCGEQNGQGLEMGKDSHEAANGGATILFVDDEQALREIAAIHLMRAGYKVITADSGELALEMYKAGAKDIDLVILDLSMPGLGGIFCLKEILTFDSAATVLVTSGYSEDTQRKDVLAMGAKEYLPKPNGKTQLLSAVRAVLNK